MKTSLQAHRRRMRENGMKRVEVCVHQEDADLIRRVAQALAADDRVAERVRSAIRASVPTKSPLSFKEWMEAASEPDET